MNDLKLNFQTDFNFESDSQDLYALIHGYGSIPWFKDWYPDNKKFDVKSKLSKLYGMIKETK